MFLCCELYILYLLWREIKKTQNKNYTRKDTEKTGGAGKDTGLHRGVFGECHKKNKTDFCLLKSVLFLHKN